MEIKLDLNSLVKVKLTDYGVTVLKANYESNKVWRFKNDVKPHDFNLNLDEDGYYTKPMWELMETFGGHMNRGQKTVFDSELILVNGTPVSEL